MPPSSNVFSFCNLPPWALASVDFQDDPAPLAIGRVREQNHRLFALLDAERDPARRGDEEYLVIGGEYRVRKLLF
jgi:NAD+--dinitrogen-reductase ADP-D-ribosyltransferase